MYNRIRKKLRAFKIHLLNKNCALEMFSRFDKTENYDLNMKIVNHVWENNLKNHFSINSTI